MKIKIFGIIILLVILGAVGYFYLFQDSDEAQVKNRFKQLASYVSKSSGEKMTSMMYKTNVVATLFADPCFVGVKNTFLSGDYSPEKITANAVRARKFFSHIELDFYDLSIDFPDPNTANTIFTARLTGKTKNGKRNIAETREMEAVLKKIDGKWLFSSVKVVEVLKK